MAQEILNIIAEAHADYEVRGINSYRTAFMQIMNVEIGNTRLSDVLSNFVRAVEEDWDKRGIDSSESYLRDLEETIKRVSM
jgi:hypothetical protein